MGGQDGQFATRRIIMKFEKKFIGLGVFLLFMFTTCALFFKVNAQRSMWQDQNPYSGALGTGNVVKVLVQENVAISSSGNADITREFKLKKNPDKNYLEFLQNVDQNESEARKYKNRSKHVESIEFQISAVLGDFAQNGRTISLNASKNINIDGNPFRVQLSGSIDPSMIYNRTIHSSDIANFVMTVQNQSPPLANNQINLKAPADANAAAQEAPPREARLSAQEQENIKLDYLRKTIGALQ